MSEFSERWLIRLMAVIVGLNWLFLILGSVPALIQFPRSAWPAIVLSGVYVVAFQLLPRRLLLRRPIWSEGAAVIATGLTAAAMTLTGSFESSFLLLAITPVMLAALFGGYRLGFATAALSAGILIAVSVPLQRLNYPSLVSWLGLLLLVAATFGLARRLLLEAMDHVEALTEITAETGARLEQLENTNVLLTRLVELTGSDELSAATVGAATVATIRAAVPFDGAEIYMLTNKVLTLVATSGTPTRHSTVVDIETPIRKVGELRLFTDRPPTDRQIEVMRDLLAPTAVSFANISMLEEIAADAIRDERLRVARELHDGIGPGLAALGLAMDVAAMGTKGALEEQLVALRSSVTGLVTDMRSAVEDLRTDPNRSTLSAIRRELIGAAPPAKITLTEATLIPQERRDNITAIALEAIRNARTHNPAAAITVTGEIDGPRGWIRIEDAGAGFDPVAAHKGRFGIVGMHERAEASGATISIESSPDTGTTVIIEWEPQ